MRDSIQIRGGAMHGYFGPGSPFGTIEQAIAAYNASGGDPSLLPYFNGICLPWFQQPWR